MPGDVLFFNYGEAALGHADHVAMYVGGGQTIEAYDPNHGVLPWPCNPDNGCERSSTDPFGVALTTAPPVFKKTFNFLGFRRRTNPVENVKLCTHSPVNLVVTDPDGLTINAQTLTTTSREQLREVPGALYYSEWQVGTDGRTDAMVRGQTLKTGYYLVRVVPKPDALLTDTFGLDLTAAGTTLNLAQNVPISEIPPNGYVIQSANGVITQVVTPIVSLSMPSILFSAEAVGTNSASQSVLITNIGNADLQVQSISVSGDFTQNSACTTTIPPGASCTINVSFAPTATGSRTAMLTIADNAPGSPHIVNLLGTATPGTPSVSWPVPTAITYGTPVGSMQLDASSNIPGSFAYNPPSGTVLQAGSRTLSVTFTPSDATDYSTVAAQVTLQVNQATPVIAWTPASIQLGYELGAAQFDATASVQGMFTYTPPSGTAIMNASQTLSVLFTPTDTTDYTTASMSVPLSVMPGPLAIVSPSSIDFGTVYLGTITIKSVTVTNQGNAPMMVTDPFISIVSGGDSKEFVMLNLCPKPLAAGKSCRIDVAFVAGPHYNPQSATIQVIDNASGSPQTVKLTAMVINPQADLEPKSLSFGSQSVNSSTTKAITLTNTGATALSITNIAITGTNTADFMQASACPTSLAAGASCTISITFKPLSKNTFAAGLTVTDNTFLGRQTVLLTGAGH